MPYEDSETLLCADPQTLTQDDLYQLEAMTHEATHLLQLCTLGYAYDIACRLMELVFYATREHKTLDAIYDHHGDYTARVSAVLDTLHREGQNGVTPLMILEGAAFLAQKVSHYDRLGPEEYARILDREAPSGEYLGADAFYLFPHVATLSLYTARPERAFPVLLEAFASEASRLDIEANHNLGLRVLEQRFAADMLLGSASQRLVAGQQHPLLRRVIALLDDMAEREHLRPVALAARGRLADDHMAKQFPGPFV